MALPRDSTTAAFLLWAATVSPLSFYIEFEDIKLWKEHFEKLLIPTNTSSVEETELGEATPIPLAEVSEVVKKFLSGKALVVEEMLKKGYPGLEASSISHGGQEQSMQNSRPISQKKGLAVLQL